MKSNYIIDYVNENEFKKKERSVKKYNMLAYKKLLFDYYPGLREGNFQGVLVSTNEKDRIDFDSKSWADAIFGTDHDSIYEGTIYIPVRTNAFTGMIGGGQYPDTQTAAEVEALIQQKERTRGYVDPGLLIN